MDMLITLLVHWRRHTLHKQAAAVRKAVHALDGAQRKLVVDQTLAEIQAAAVLPLPHLHGDSDPVMYRPWSPVAAVAASRVRDRSILLRQRSIALWLAVVYHETRQSPDAGLQAVHREVLGILRELRDARPLTTTESAWFKAAA